MFTVSDKDFEEIVADAIDNIPSKYATHLKNLAFVVADVPSAAQRQRLHLHNNQTLFGLYEGVPLTQRGSGYNLVLPDKITIFKQPIEWTVNSRPELVEQVKHTLWHEVAHYYGLDHGRINELDNK
jgi:predicted Zn-dependent protease with MMP-like domain